MDSVDKKEKHASEMERERNLVELAREKNRKKRRIILSPRILEKEEWLSRSHVENVALYVRLDNIHLVSSTILVCFLPEHEPIGYHLLVAKRQGNAPPKDI